MQGLLHDVETSHAAVMTFLVEDSFLLYLKKNNIWNLVKNIVLQMLTVQTI